MRGQPRAAAAARPCTTLEALRPTLHLRGELTPFEGPGDILGPNSALRGAVLRHWCITLQPPRGVSRAPAQVRVFALVDALIEALTASPLWPEALAQMGGSGAIYGLGGLGPAQKPHDLDPLIVVARSGGASLDQLEEAVLTAVRAFYQRALGLDPSAASALRLRPRRLGETPDGKGLLTLRVGHQSEHVDLRFSFADARTPAFDFVCNALVCRMHDSSRWYTLPGADAGAALADIDAGVYRSAHPLTNGSMVRAWKMAARGFVPATAAQERGMWAQFADYLDTESEGECKGPQLRLAEYLHRYLGPWHPDTPLAERQSALSLLANALTSLHTFGMPKHQAMVTAQLQRLLEARCAGLTLDVATKAVLQSATAPYQAGQAARWLEAWASPATRLVWPNADASSHLSLAVGGVAGCIRRFVPALGGFVLFYPPETQACDVPPASWASTSLDARPRRVEAAAALGTARLAQLCPMGAPADDGPEPQAAKRLVEALAARPGDWGLDAVGRLTAALRLDAEVCVPEALWAHVCGQSQDAGWNVTLQQHRQRRVQLAFTQLTATQHSPQARQAAWQMWQQSFVLQARPWAARLIAHLATQGAVAPEDVAPVGALCAALGAPDSADALAAWVVLRAVLGHQAPPDVRQALRPALMAMRRAAAAGRTSAWLAALRLAAQTPDAAHAIAAVWALDAGGGNAMPEDIATALLTHVRGRHAAPSMVHATAAACARWGHASPLWPKLWPRRDVVAMLLGSPKHRGDCLALLGAHPPAAYAACLQLATTTWLAHRSLGAMPASWAKDPKASQMVLAHAQRAIFAAPDLNALCALWRRLAPVLENPSAAATGVVAALVDAFGTHGLPTHAPPRAKRALPLPDSWLRHIARLPDALPLGAELGRAFLVGYHGDPAGALAGLVAHAPAALLQGECPQAFAACAAALLAYGDSHTLHDPHVLRGLAALITRVPALHPSAAPAARTLLVAFVLHCSDARVFEASVKALVHADVAWQLEGVGAALAAQLDLRASWHKRSNFFVTLNWGFNDARYTPTLGRLSEPLLVRELEHLAEQWNEDNDAHRLVRVDMLLTIIRARGRLVPRHAQAPISGALRTLWRALPDDVVRPRLFEHASITSHVLGPWSWLWLAWIEAAPTSAQAHRRARDVAARIGEDDINPAAAQDLSPQTTHVMLNLMPWLCRDPDTNAFDTVTWHHIAAACLQSSPTLWWMQTLCNADVDTRAQLTQTLVEKLETSCRAEFRVARPSIEQRNRQCMLALALLHTTAYHLDGTQHALAVRAARTALTLTREHWDRDPASWVVLGDALCQRFPQARLALMPVLEKLARRHSETKYAPPVSYAIWLHTSVAPLLGSPDPALIAQGLRLLMHAEAGWPDDARQLAAWRATLAAVARRAGGPDLLRTHLHQDWQSWQLTQIPVKSMTMLFDCLADAQALTPEIWYGCLMQTARAAARLQEHAGLTALLKRMSLRAQQQPSPALGDGAQRLLLDWSSRLPRSSSLSRAIRALMAQSA